MTLAISINKQTYRNDSTILPILTISGITDIGKIKLKDWEYLDASNGTQTLNPPNKSLDECPIILRNVKAPSSWTKDTGIIDNSNGFLRSSGSGVNGAFSSTALSSVKSSIEAKIVSLYDEAPTDAGLVDYLGISLQTGTPNDDYTNALVAHSITFGDFGKATIRELGQIPKVNGTFLYEIGDTPIIELSSGIVRYYLTKPNGEMFLIRTTRSKLTDAPKPHAFLRLTGGQMDDVLTFSNEETQITFKNVAVFFLQAWLDEYTINPTSDALQMADNQSEYTYSGHKKFLRSLGLSRAFAPKSDRNEYIKFFEYHLFDKDFIFVDKARKNINIVGNKYDEFWCNFSSGFSEKTRSGCLFANNVQIVENNRDEYIPIETAESTPPTIPSSFNFTGGSGTMTGTWGESTDTESGLQKYILKVELDN